jgi:hypothetical protein
VVRGWCGASRFSLSSSSSCFLLCYCRRPPGDVLSLLLVVRYQAFRGCSSLLWLLAFLKSLLSERILVSL